MPVVTISGTSSANAVTITTAGIYSVNLGSGNDILLGGNSEPGGNSSDLVLGGEIALIGGDASISSIAANNAVIYGNAGSDTILGGSGAYTVYGGSAGVDTADLADFILLQR